MGKANAPSVSQGSTSPFCCLDHFCDPVRTYPSTLVENGAAVLETSRQFDANNRLTAQALALVDKTYSECYTYDEYGRLSAMEHTQGGWNSEITYTYDELSRLVKVTTPVYEIAYTYYTGTSQISRMRYNLLSTTGTDITYSYQYDELGNITRIADSINGVQQYSYDALGQPSWRMSRHRVWILLSTEPLLRSHHRKIHQCGRLCIHGTGLPGLQYVCILWE